MQSKERKQLDKRVWKIVGCRKEHVIRFVNIKKMLGNNRTKNIK